MTFDDNTAEYMRKLKKQVTDAAGRAGMILVRSAKENISGRTSSALKAVDTGRLMNSISVSNSEEGPSKGRTSAPAKSTDGVSKPIKKQKVITVVVGSNVEYAPYIELGMGSSRSIGPRPFLRKALETNRNRILQAFKLR